MLDTHPPDLPLQIGAERIGQKRNAIFIALRIAHHDVPNPKSTSFTLRRNASNNRSPDPYNNCATSRDVPDMWPNTRLTSSADSTTGTRLSSLARAVWLRSPNSFPYTFVQPNNRALNA